MDDLQKLMKEMEKGPDLFAAAIQGISDAVLARRPDGKNWAAKEIICHLRDTEELFINRFQAIVAMDDPKFFPADADRWAEERQYLRNDIQEALSAFRKRRSDTLNFLRELEPGQWNRVGIHATRGRETLKGFAGNIPKHDVNHIDQLKRALAGKP